MYQKLFSIEYNDKVFMVYMDTNNRKTFLEIDNADNYSYPLLEDFITLNEIFNNDNPFVFYGVSRYKFTEKVWSIKRGVATLLTIVTVITNTPLVLAKEVKLSEEEERLIAEVIGGLVDSNKEKQFVVKIDNPQEVDAYLGKIDVDKEMVLEAIDNNDKLPLRYKNVAKRLLYNLTSQYPDINLRIFYENIKSMDCKKDIKNSKIPGAAAYYDAVANAIVVNDEESLTDELLEHELFHPWYSVYRAVNGQIITRNEKYSALVEAMTDVAANEDSYKFAGAVLKYFRSLVDFSIEDFNNKGIEDLVSRLSSKYPEIDFNYIDEVMKAVNNNLIKLNRFTYIDDTEDLLNELFKICLKDADDALSYAPFQKFANLFAVSRNPELVFDYLEKYNEYLKSKGCTSIVPVENLLKSYRVYSKVNGLSYNDNGVFPVVRDDAGNMMKIDGEKSIKAENCPYFPSSNLQSLISCSMFCENVKFGSREFWTNLAKKYYVISPHYFEDIPIYRDGVLLKNDRTNNLFVKVGETDGKKIGFVLLDRTGKVIFGDTHGLKNESNMVNLNTYLLGFSKRISRLDIADIFNEDWLIKSHQFFNNVVVRDDKLSVEPFYKISIRRGDEVTECTLNSCSIAEDEGIVSISGVDISFNMRGSLTKSFSLKDVLSFYKVINSEVTTYSFTDGEIIDLVNQYVLDNNLINDLGAIKKNAKVGKTI